MKTGVFFISHIYNSYTLSRYNELKNSLIEGQELIWLSTCPPNRSDFFETNLIEKSIIISLTDEEYFYDPRKKYGPNNSILFTKLYEQMNQYDFYWFIEYDVTINTKRNDKFRTLFEYYNNSRNFEYDADVIGDHIHSYYTHQAYCLRYPYETIKNKYPQIEQRNIGYRDIHFGFYTICRLSKKFLEIFSKDEDFIKLYFEWGITTYAYLNNFKICTFNNVFSYDMQNKERSFHHQMNKGSNSFQTKSYKEYWDEYPEYTIIHAVKEL